MKIDIESSTWISLAEHLTWVTRTMNGSFPKIPTMIWCWDRWCETGRGAKRRNSKEQWVLTKSFLRTLILSFFFKWHDFCFLSLAYIKRVIAHPSFHNINFKQAEKMMESMDQGDVWFDPAVNWRTTWRSHGRWLMGSISTWTSVRRVKRMRSALDILFGSTMRWAVVVCHT